MRNDFTSVVAERARYGRYRVHAKNDAARTDIEELATSQSMKSRWQHNLKEKRVHLAPLRRYLRAQVGRPWDHVYSDICHVFQANIAGDRRLTDYIGWEVETNIRKVGDELITEHGYPVGGNTLFVHPETGILTVLPATPRRRWQNKPRFETVAIDSEHKLVKIDDLWFEVTLATIPGADVTVRPFDVVLNRPVFADDINTSWGNEFYRSWGPGLYASAKRQANSREIRRLVAPAADSDAAGSARSGSARSDSDAAGSAQSGSRNNRKPRCHRPQGRRH